MVFALCLRAIVRILHFWIAKAVKRMLRYMKLGTRWHRLAMRRLCPELLKFRYDETNKPMAEGPRLQYWLGFSPIRTMFRILITVILLVVALSRRLNRRLHPHSRRCFSEV